MSDSFLDQISGAGSEQLEKMESMPLLKLIQSNSPELIEGNDKYIDGCKGGDIVFAAEGKILPRPITFVVVSNCKLYAEWKPKSAGGGLVRHHSPGVVAHPRYRKGDTTSEHKEFLGENDLINTHYFLVEFLDGDIWKKGILAMSSTQLTAAARPLNNRLEKFTHTPWPEEFKVPPSKDKEPRLPPIFAQMFHLNRVASSNKKGNFFNWEVTPGEILNPMIKENIAILDYFFHRYNECVEKKELPMANETPALTVDDTSAIDIQDIV